MSIYHVKTTILSPVHGTQVGFYKCTTLSPVHGTQLDMAITLFMVYMWICMLALRTSIQSYEVLW